MSDFFNSATQGSLTVKLWRGERMCLIGMDVTDPKPDFIGFSIEVKEPGAADYVPLKNRLNFSYDAGGKGVDGFRNFDSTQAPFEKFRWLHFPETPSEAPYFYRISMLHMPADGQITIGDQVKDLSITLDKEDYDGCLDVGFTRNFASSQAFNDRCAAAVPPIDPTKLIPSNPDDGLTFQKIRGDIYQWLGFEAYELLFGLLDEVVNDPTLSLDVFAYDFNEPDVVDRLVKCGNRVRAVIDNSGSHAPDTSAESQAAAKLQASAGCDAVVRMHFHTLQHNKVLIVKRNGTPERVLFGSTNFSFRGLYIQANNMLVFHSPDVAELFEMAFELALAGGDGFAADPLAGQWHLVQSAGTPKAQFCFSPHQDTDLSLNPVGDAINNAMSSVFYAIAFLNQTKSGAVRSAINQLMTRDVFSYGISDKEGGLTINKPDGSVGQVDFSYLAKVVPEPFSSEWNGGAGIHQHDKFVVCDFNLPTATIFTGSSNLSPSGESGNGDNLVMIQDQRVATAYAIEALRIFDHLQFRNRMQEAEAANTPITLAKPVAISGTTAPWFAPFYVDGSQKARDRLLFSH